MKYSTVQNWFPGDNNTGGILNFVTKRALCEAKTAKCHGRQSETGSAITWKYPSCILRGDNSIGEFYSVALTSGHQQADTGTKMIHIGKNTKSTIISKGISAGHSQNSYRGLVKIMPTATNARNFTQCDSMLIGANCGAHTFRMLSVVTIVRNWNTRQRHHVLVKINCFTACNAGSAKKTPSRCLLTVSAKTCLGAAVGICR